MNEYETDYYADWLSMQPDDVRAEYDAFNDMSEEYDLVMDCEPL